MSEDWKFLFERVKRTVETFNELTGKCETTLRTMWLIEDEIMKLAKERGKVLPPQKAFVLAYFRRNTIYLQASYVISAMAFSSPSVNVQRTVYETILRGYLFIINPAEARLYYDNLETVKEEDFLKSRRFYGHKYLCEQLYKPKSIEKHRKLYEFLCFSAHAEIKGLLHDFPKYRKKDVEYRLKIMLSLSYGNIQMVAEMFREWFNTQLRNLVKNALKDIVISLEKQVPLFEPDKDVYTSKLKLRKGNFMQVL